VQGSGVDASLNDKGRSQAEAFYDFYRLIPFEKIFVSKLKRSKESIASFINDGLPFEEHIALNEISWGNREGQKITPEEDAYYHDILRRWQEGETSIPIEGGESPDEVAFRQKPILNIIRSSNSDKPILICMHGRAMRILLCQFLNYPLGSMDMFEHENLGLYLLTRTQNQFTVDLYNNTDHLAVLKGKVMRVMTSAK